jgi:hypothetical protein
MSHPYHQTPIISSTDDISLSLTWLTSVKLKSWPHRAESLGNLIFIHSQPPHTHTSHFTFIHRISLAALDCRATRDNPKNKPNHSREALESARSSVLSVEWAVNHTASPVDRRSTSWRLSCVINQRVAAIFFANKPNLSKFVAGVCVRARIYAISVKCVDNFHFYLRHIVNTDASERGRAEKSYWHINNTIDTYCSRECACVCGPWDGVEVAGVWVRIMSLWHSELASGELLSRWMMIFGRDVMALRQNFLKIFLNFIIFWRF